ncbi:amino acid/amide ABC transporter ATP-binding protein 1, HAAT family [Desulfonispora thiosulfatigenes DSM 11270]|uniref:Amino acid/amide ABC transporter ATP-binding protein 1, HAAT family n=1 Tax=Desulfonispora thiosulfatigenes DSM 11270 TaxID=656914 RepID=A0A1W1UE32_DESTI|nr:ABC transporter ATP-binding protein [Desulfonispora thiosulfatigenes]SMB79292.1 amino acid/amide ABC transporter ATP-binding protein 1, HAAT family [Desulfonispora thiosulfatigenes DSM 11270]
MSLMQVEKLTKSFGGLTAVSNVNMDLQKGELVGLIGPNGAGKTTLFNLLTGVYVPTSGSITLNIDGKKQSIAGRKPYDITKLGVARTFQNIRLFKDLTVLDNVRIAMHQNVKYGLGASFIHTPAYYREEKELLKMANELLEIFKLDNKKNDLSKNLSYGEQRHLEIARALATKPSLLLLDEPAAGMNPAETAALTESIKWLREEFNLTILLIEHDMSLVMKICERINVLDYGMLIASGVPEEIKSNKRVIEAYLGGEVNA